MIEPDSASESESSWTQRCLNINILLPYIHTVTSRRNKIITHLDLLIRNYHSMLVALSYHLDSGQLLCFYSPSSVLP